MELNDFKLYYKGIDNASIENIVNKDLGSLRLDVIEILMEEIIIREMPNGLLEKIDTYIRLGVLEKKIPHKILEGIEIILKKYDIDVTQESVKLLEKEQREKELREKDIIEKSKVDEKQKNRKQEIKDKLGSLERLSELLNSGNITEVEFNTMKDELLNPRNQSKENSQLIDLKELLKSGTISEEEFDKLKREILNLESQNFISKTNTEKTSNDIKQKIYNFNTGVKLTINSIKIQIEHGEGSNTIDSKNFDNVSYTEFVEPRITPAQLFTIPFIVGIILVFLGNESERSPLFMLGLLLLGVGIIGFAFVFLNSQLGSNLDRKLIAQFYSYKGYVVTIGNKSGNNIDFITHQDELHKIKLVEKQLDKLKQILN